MKHTQQYMWTLLGSAALLTATGDATGEFLDLSDELNNPTVLELKAGNNIIGNTVVNSGGTAANADIDFLTVVVGSGLQLDAVVLSRYEGPAVSFVAFAEGPTLPANPVGTPAEQQTLAEETLGFALFGEAQVGGTLLINLAFGDVTIDPARDEPDRRLEGALRYDPFEPFGPGSYAFVLQDTGPALVTYELDFQTSAVPEPGAAASVALSGIAFAMRRRRRQLPHAAR